MGGVNTPCYPSRYPATHPVIPDLIRDLIQPSVETKDPEDPETISGRLKIE